MRFVRKIVQTKSVLQCSSFMVAAGGQVTFSVFTTLGTDQAGADVFARILIGGRVSLTAATLSGMLDRLEELGLLQRQRDDQDRRRQWLLLSDAGHALMQESPTLLPPGFRRRFDALSEWERHALTAALLRAAELCGDGEG